MIRSILGAVVGLLFGIFVGLDLVLLGVLSTGTFIVFLLALGGLLIGGWLGFRASRRRHPAS